VGAVLVIDTPLDGNGMNKLRRRILEWTFWLSIVAFFGVISLEAASYLVSRSERFIAVGGHYSLRTRVYALLRPGWIDLANDLDSTSAQPGPMILIPRNIVFPPVWHRGSVTVPGFKFSFCLLQRGAGALWSASCSLLVPLAVFGFMALISFHRLKRLQNRAALSGPPPESATVL
jgi:hypothetical protein